MSLTMTSQVLNYGAAGRQAADLQWRLLDLPEKNGFARGCPVQRHGALLVSINQLVMLFTSHRNTPDEKVIKRKRRSPAGAWWERICGIWHPMRRQGLFFSRSCFQKLTHAKSEEKARKCIVAAAPASSARTEYRQKRTHTTKDRVHTAVDSFSHQCSR